MRQTDTPENRECKHRPGQFVPLLDRNRCEGKAACVTVCPVQVFAVQRLPEQQRTGLSLKGRVKGYFHQWRQAVLVNPDACEGCGLCVKACPEGAIRLVRSAPDQCENDPWRESS